VADTMASPCRCRRRGVAKATTECPSTTFRRFLPIARTSFGVRCSIPKCLGNKTLTECLGDCPVRTDPSDMPFIYEGCEIFRLLQGPCRRQRELFTGVYPLPVAGP